MTEEELVEHNIRLEKVNQQLSDFRLRIKFPTNYTPTQYKQYITSPTWEIKRKHTIAFRNGKCEICQSRQQLNVHHLIYGSIENETLEELAVLCRKCHFTAHNRSNRRKILPSIATTKLILMIRSGINSKGFDRKLNNFTRRKKNLHPPMKKSILKQESRRARRKHLLKIKQSKMNLLLQRSEKQKQQLRAKGIPYLTMYGD